MKKTIIITLIILLSLGIIGGGVGYYFFSKAPKDFATSDADYKMTAKELFDSMVQASKNNKTPEFISADKTVQINGKIKEIVKNEDGTFLFSIEPGSTEGSVSCTLAKSESETAQKYKIGQNVTLKGQVTGLQDLIETEVIMIGCGLVE